MDGLIFGILWYTSCGGLFCGYLQSSQEKLKTLMLIQNFGGQRRYITGDLQVADLEKKLQRPKTTCVKCPVMHM